MAKFKMKPIYWMIVLILAFLTLGNGTTFQGAISGSESVVRTIPSQVNIGETFDVTYTVIGGVPNYGVSVQDSLIGGCTFSDGSTSLKTVILSDAGIKTISVVAPSTSSTCSFSNGDYKFGTLSIVGLPDVDMSVGSPQGDTTLISCGNYYTLTDSCPNVAYNLGMITVLQSSATINNLQVFGYSTSLDCIVYCGGLGDSCGEDIISDCRYDSTSKFEEEDDITIKELYNTLKGYNYGENTYIDPSSGQSTIIIKENYKGYDYFYARSSINDPNGFFFDGTNKLIIFSAHGDTKMIENYLDIVKGATASEVCTENWSPISSSVCSGESFTQKRCEGETNQEQQQAIGTKDCSTTCTDTTYDGTDPSNVCIGETTTHTNDCGDTQVVSGTKDCGSAVCDFWEKVDTNGECKISNGFLLLVGLAVGLILIMRG